MNDPLRYEFDHIHIMCSDLAATEKWFVGGVGAELVERRESRGVPTSVLSLAGLRVLLRGSREDENLAAAGERRFGTDHFGLQVADVDATVETLRGRGVEIAIEPRDSSPTSRIAFIRGPDDVRIELVQRS